ncbi:DUF58 domain-containing protein [Microbacterium sp. STN6]|uniref:DUF58 domain-containing protein n=1 Tax=Microbacterium sp. STN6 TaxID=2995588 RepID=UPI00226089C1|nr:DUF58 domain-containing protein [Microbacterium sp. STN6]MCX7521640.1 DUF58 domain-containing protein [Microbacterium sp. STN6]
MTATAASAEARHWPLWAVSAAVPAAVIVAVLGAAAGLLWGSPQTVLVALPLAASVALTRLRRPAPGPITLHADVGGRAEDSRLEYGIEIAAAPDVEAMQLRLSLLATAPSDVIVTRAAARRITGSLPVLHSGPQEMVRLASRAIGAGGQALGEPSPEIVVRGSVAPKLLPIGSLPLPRRLTGLTGTHDSSRPGDGGEFRDIHLFAPGDRLRRIDWKTTARRGSSPGDLYVRRSNATADVTLMLVVDSRDDVGENVADWSRGTAHGKGLGSMDIARTAASSIAAAYVQAGDRVGFQDLASPSRVIAPGGGNRHLQRVLRAVELTQPSGASPYRLRAPLIPPGTLVWVFSTFLDDETARMAALWRAAGHRVLAVDTLPRPNLSRLSRQGALAHRVVMMERDDRMRDLAATGVERLEWQDSASSSRAAALRSLARLRGRGAR